MTYLRTNLFVVFLILGLTVQAQVDLLGGTAFSSSGRIFNIMHLPSTAMHQGDTLVGVTGIPSGESTFDHKHGHYYTRSNSSIYVVDVNQRNIIKVIQDTTNMLGMEYDTTTGLLFGLSWNGQVEQFISRDPISGVVQVLDTLPGVTGVGAGESTLDAIHRRYFTVAGPPSRIFVINLTTGKIDTAFANTRPIKGVEYDPVSDQLYANYYNGTDQVLTQMDIATGALQDIGIMDGVNGVAAGENTFDAAKGYYYLRSPPDIRIFDIQNAQLVQAITQSTILGIEYFQGTLAASVKEGLSQLSFDYYPNPVQHTLHLAIDAEASLVRVKVRTGLGQEIEVPQARSNTQMVVDVSLLSPGIYFVEVATSLGVGVAKFVKH